MNTYKPRPFRMVSVFFLCLAIFFTSFAGASTPLRSSPDSAVGSLCNYSSWDLVVMVQKNGHPRMTTWKMVPAGRCQNERVIGVLGSANANSNALPQMIMINGYAIALDSLRANPVPGLGFVTIVSPSRSARTISSREAYMLYRQLIKDNPGLVKLGYSLQLLKINSMILNAGLSAAIVTRNVDNNTTDPGKLKPAVDAGMSGFGLLPIAWITQSNGRENSEPGTAISSGTFHSDGGSGLSATVVVT